MLLGADGGTVRPGRDEPCLDGSDRSTHHGGENRSVAAAGRVGNDRSPVGAGGDGGCRPPLGAWAGGAWKRRHEHYRDDALGTRNWFVGPAGTAVRPPYRQSTSG